MTSASPSLLARLLAPDRAWKGERALAPVEICYRVLDIYSYAFGLFGLFAVVMIYFRAGSAVALHNPIYWFILGAMVVQAGGAILRGLPFSVRFGILMVCLWIFNAGTLLALGVTPNLPFAVIMFISSCVLFYGTRAGWIALSLLCLLYGLAAWGWIARVFPAYLTGPSESHFYMDFTVGAVWVRVVAGMIVLTTAFLFIMDHVLKGLNAALRESNRSLQVLAHEQEQRARAEEARLQAERAAREAQKFDALGRLASGVAHDINNALCVVKCWNSVLSADSSDPLVREAMAEVGVATENATQLTQHLLAFSKRDTVRTETVDLTDAVRREARTLSHLLPKTIEVRAEVTEPLYVRLGRGQLQEIILNLALNARDAMPSGGRLTLRVKREIRPAAAPGGAPAALAVLEASDTGVGMDEAVIARIFEPFFTTKPHGQGTGLGLAMVYGVVTGASGSIRVESKPGHGSTFFLEFPAAVPAAGAGDKSAAPVRAEAKCHVVVADDNQEVRNLIGRIMQREGFSVSLAKTGDEAMALLSDGVSPGLLIVDGVMPGCPTAELIRVAEHRWPDCRVVISSGHQQSELVRSGIDAGRFILLPKPFELGQLRAAVNLALGNKN